MFSRELTWTPRMIYLQACVETLLRGAITPFVLSVLMQSMAQKQKARRMSVIDLAPMAQNWAVCLLVVVDQWLISCTLLLFLLLLPRMRPHLLCLLLLLLCPHLLCLLLHLLLCPLLLRSLCLLLLCPHFLRLFLLLKPAKAGISPQIFRRMQKPFGCTPPPPIFLYTPHCQVCLSVCVHAARETKASGHSGILESAKAVLEDLQSTGILEGLLLNAPVRKQIEKRYSMPLA